MTVTFQSPVAGRAKVCLVAMPFLPVLCPSLGISALKAELAQAGIPCDVHYAAVDFFHDMVAATGSAAAMLDYQLIASSTDIGETLFGAALWDRPDLEDQSSAVIADFLNAADRTLDRRLVEQSVARLLPLPSIATQFIDRQADIRDWGRYDVIGFSTVFSQTTASLALARRIKARWPKTTILFGGPNVDGDMGLALMAAFPFVDAVLRGEADLTLPRFLALADGARHDIPGVILRQNGHPIEGRPALPVMNLDQRALPDFTDYFATIAPVIQGGLNPAHLLLPIETSRGCWWGAVKHCVFCGLNPTTMEFRSKSPARALAEFDALATRWGIRQFFAVDNIIDMSYFRKVLPDLADRDYHIFYETKSNLKETHVQALARAGVTSIQPGLEGLNTEILALMQKGVKARQNIELLKWCRQHGVDPLWFYLYGFPGERAEPYLQDIRLIPLLWHLPPPRNANPIVLDRYSPLYRDREALGLVPLIPSGNSAIYFAGLTLETRIALAYHFENRASIEVINRYENALWRAVLTWKHQFEAGAYLVQVAGRGATLVADGRGRQDTAYYLLTGAAHRLLAQTRSALDPATLAVSGPADIDPLDFGLVLTALSLGATVLDAEDTDTAQTQLCDAGLGVTIDGLLLALPIDLAPGPLAIRLEMDGLLTGTAAPSPQMAL